MTAQSAEPFLVTADKVHQMAEELAGTASHPEFLKMLTSVQSAPEPEKRSVAQDVARVERVAALGIPVPSTFRLTTRTFEEPVAQGPSPDSAAVTFDGRSGSVALHGRKVTVTTREALSEVDASERVQAEIKRGIEEIGQFVTSAPFQAMLVELAALGEEERPGFVADQLLDPEKREARGIHVPAGMKLQRSNFADGRPTLFCVSQVLPMAHPWHKVTITFDNA